MIKLMSKILLLFAVVLSAGLLVSANIPVSRSHLGAKDVLGTHLSKASPKIITSGGKSGFVSNTAGAVSTFPLRVDQATGALTVTTPKGEKVVTVLPDAAIKNMLASKVMSYVTSVSSQGELASTDKLITLLEKDGTLVYEISGARNYKLLGLIPLKSKVKAYVSAENGQVLRSEQSLLGRILNRIAP